MPFIKYRSSSAKDRMHCSIIRNYVYKTYGLRSWGDWWRIKKFTPDLMATFYILKRPDGHDNILLTDKRYLSSVWMNFMAKSSVWRSNATFKSIHVELYYMDSTLPNVIYSCFGKEKTLMLFSKHNPKSRVLFT